MKMCRLLRYTSNNYGFLFIWVSYSFSFTACCTTCCVSVKLFAALSTISFKMAVDPRHGARVTVDMPVYAVQWCGDKLYIGGGGGSTATGIQNVMLAAQLSDTSLKLNEKLKIDMGILCVWCIARHMTSHYMVIGVGDGYVLYNTNTNEIEQSRFGIEVRDGDESALVCNYVSFIMVRNL